MNKTTVIALALFGLGTLGLAGCGHYREMREDAFATRVADKCMEAAQQPTRVVVVPAPASTVVVAPAEPK